MSYETLEQIIVGTAPINVRAIDPGSVGNLVAGANMAFAAPPPGVDTAVTVIEMDGAADIETDDELRARVLAPHPAAARRPTTTKRGPSPFPASRALGARRWRWGSAP